MIRHIEKYLKEWKNSANRKPLILRGARQVGKTYIIKKLANEEFEHFLYLNIEQESGLQSIFKSNNPELIINELTSNYLKIVMHVTCYEEFSYNAVHSNLRS